MKQWFLTGIFVLIPLCTLLWLLYSVGRYFWSVLEDWRETRNLDEIASEAAARRASKSEDDAGRLDNGCEHNFTGGLGFPPDVCPKCGLSKIKPKGHCDHIWKRIESPVPASVCEACGKQFRAGEEA